MPNVKSDTQFSVFLVNKPGILSSITKTISDTGANIFALSLVDSGEHGVLRIVGDNADAIRASLKENHDRWTETEILVIPIDNNSGAFAELSSNLADNDVNVTYCYCTACDCDGQASAIFKCKDTEKALAVLNK